MNFERHNVTERYDLRRLGLYDLPPMKAASIVTETVFDCLHPTCASFIVFDDLSNEGIFQAVARRLKAGTRFPLHRAAIAPIRDGAKTFQISDLLNDAPQAIEHTEFGLGSFLAAPVAGPDGQPIGALAVFDTAARNWPKMDYQRIENLAYLITQEVILRASFATLELMSGDRGGYRM